MSTAEMSDNLAYLSALSMVKRLADKGLLTEEEAESVRSGLAEQFRPTV